MKASTPELMKFKRLQRRLKMSTATLVGHLELLWLATAKNAPEGDIGRFSNEDIAIACYWDGDPDEFVDALVECRWLDADSTWRLLVHDWSEHAPTYVHGCLKRHGKSFRNSTKEVTKEPPKQAPKEPAIGTSSEDTPTKPSLTKPSQDLAKPNQVKPSEEEGESASAAASPPPAPTTSPADLLEAWNAVMGQRCEMTEKRTKAARLRLKDPKWVERWRVALDRCSASDFCRGVNDRGWAADFEWFIKPESVTRLLEGKYDNRDRPRQKTFADMRVEGTQKAIEDFING